MVEKSPDAFRTISEAAEELGLPQHVLRFWETRFSTIKPLKRGGGRRYYRPEDVLLLKGIRHLLYDRGYTIKGVQRILRTQGSRYVVAIADGGPLDELSPGMDDEPPAEGARMNGSADGAEVSVPVLDRARADPPASRLAPEHRERLEQVLKELLDCKRLLERARET